MTELYDLLKRCAIPFEQFDHKAVFTCEESEALGLEMPGARH
ncbi:MAG TPA: hypothetical protein VJB60_02050 [Candidatus Peribacterales bacterium]|nr:hypothetical protein [Candidatus Peribacterales bacterium]